ncbi:MAG: YggS family pyridoxal phosphate-dependent enzyme [Deltaproteobacteria bacterium]|nr:YggS family pyridoxal phosphate-dependent enzyme [Deltaproteobacteria bacterium]
MNRIAENLKNVREKIYRAAKRSGRHSEDILLLAISKTMPVDRIRAAASAGQADFGENRVQEAGEKIPQLPENLVWHMVGHLQKNKARNCPFLFKWIHSIDSIGLAREVARRYKEASSVCRTLVQVSVSGEEAKFGCRPMDVPEVLSVLLEEDGVKPCGLMTIPPFSADPEDSREYFRKLKKLRDDLDARGFPPWSIRELSMGMSGDYEVAIEEGATIVRVGTAVFGRRDY